MKYNQQLLKQTLAEVEERVSEALKFNNSRLLGVERLQEAIYSFLSKAPELKKVENLEVEDPKRLAEDQKKLGRLC